MGSLTHFVQFHPGLATLEDTSEPEVACVVTTGVMHMDADHLLEVWLLFHFVSVSFCFCFILFHCFVFLCCSAVWAASQPAPPTGITNASVSEAVFI